jgi:ubiquitin C-terminal hydrolase
MAEAPSSKQQVTVPGMCNTGNTCYLNAALQAMASSQLLCDGISQLAGFLQASSSSSSSRAGQQQSAAVQVLAAVKAAVKFILHGGWDVLLLVLLLLLLACCFMCL